MKTQTRIKCPQCESAYLKDRIAAITGSRKEESFTVDMDALVCPKCDFKTVPKDRAAQFALRVANAYRQKHGLLTSLDLKDLRCRFKMTQKQFYDFIGVGEASGKRWELGEIQSRAMDRLVRLAVEERLRTQCRYREWGGFEQLEEKMVLQVYQKKQIHQKYDGTPEMAHGPPSETNQRKFSKL
jgi:putative zinc finger/helix-turn-helix YgiT family protein